MNLQCKAEAAEQRYGELFYAFQEVFYAYRRMHNAFPVDKEGLAGPPPASNQLTILWQAMREFKKFQTSQTLLNFNPT